MPFIARRKNVPKSEAMLDSGPSTVMSQTVSPLALAHLSHLQAGVGMGSGVGRPVSGIDRVGSPLEVLRKSCKRRCPPVALPSVYQTRANLEPSSGGQGSCLLFPSTFTLSCSVSPRNAHLTLKSNLCHRVLPNRCLQYRTLLFSSTRSLR